MRNLLSYAGIAVVILALTGCFQVETVIKVNRDGSGTVEESMLMSKKAIAQLTGLMQDFAGQDGKKPKEKPPVFDLYDPPQLKARAARMGEGVSYLSGRRVEEKEFQGYRATYAFKDINRLVMHQNPGKDLAGGAATIDDGSKPDKVPVIFRFSKGTPSTLTISHQREKASGKPRQTEIYEEPVNEKIPKADAGTGEDVEKFLEIMQGMKFSLAIEVQGNVVQTNATHREGSRITVMDLDFGKLLGKPEQLAGMKALQMQSLDDAKQVLKAIPGMKIDLNDELTVSFE
jgi:hypothetical protein